MYEANRVKLLGKYRTPRFKYGAVVTCAIRGEVKIVGLSNGRIPWPTCTVLGGRPLVVYGALAQAIRRESAEAVKYWFGVQDTVWKWRKALAASARRYRIGVAAFVKRRPHRAPAKWTPEKDRLLGTMSDVDLARKLRCSPMSVFYRRRRLKVEAFRA